MMFLLFRCMFSQSHSRGGISYPHRGGKSLALWSHNAVGALYK